MTRVLLLLPSSTYRATDFVEAAAVIGTEIVVASDVRQAMAGHMGERTLTLDLADASAAADEIVAHAQHTPLDAVVAVDDRGVVPAARAAARLGLRHNDPDAVAATRDKTRLRGALAAFGVPQPAYRIVGPDGDVVAAATDVGFPCVVKPVSLSGSQGVIRADDPEQAALAGKRVHDILACSDEDPDGPLLVEAFAPGDEVAVEGLLRNGRLEVLAVFDKPDPLDGPYFEETLYVTPSRKAPRTLQRIAELSADAAAALGLEEGPVHAELRVDGDDIRVLELAARSIGGLCSRALRFGLGASLEELILRHALDLPLDTLRREPAASGVMMLPIPQAGVFEGVDGLEEAQAVDGVVGLEITVPRGRDVVPVPEGDRYLGFLFARGETPQDVEQTLRRADGLLDTRITAG